MQIIILGMHRSGTSLATRLINLMGAYFGPEGVALPAGPDNPTGFWERSDAMQLNDALLAHNGCAWDRPAAWPDRLKPAAPQHEAAIRALLAGMNAHKPWVLKDPRLCLTFPYWQPQLESAVAVLCHRNPLEAAQSLEKRNRMPVEYGLALWEHYAAGALNAALELPCVRIAHADLLRDPAAGVRALKDGLEAAGVRGLRLPPEREITAFVDPALYHARAGSEKLSGHQQMLQSLMTGETRQTGPVSASAEAAERLRKGYQRSA